MRYGFLSVTVQKWLKSVHTYRSYRKIKKQGSYTSNSKEKKGKGQNGRKKKQGKKREKGKIGEREQEGEDQTPEEKFLLRPCLLLKL